MSAHCGYIVKVEQLRPHPNADRLQIATFFGNDTCVGLDIKIGDIGIYFPCDLQLSMEFCINNHMLKKLPDGTPDGGYMDAKKRNVTAIRLRGEKSDGIYCSLKALEYTGVKLHTLSPGDTITTVNGHEICKKYIPMTKPQPNPPQGNRTRKKKVPIAPLFAQHVDTEQLDYNLGAFRPGDEIEITLKMHGTSHRVGYLPVAKKQTLLDKLLKRIRYDWDYISGTRRVVLEKINTADGWYGDNAFRKNTSEKFIGKLHKGETVYMEIVGYVNETTPIMPSCNNKKLNDKAFIKKYGDTTNFSYGCAPGENECYVYRMTLTTEEGHVVEYSPEYMRYRCEQIGVKAVPEFYRGFLPDVENLGEKVRDIAKVFYDGDDSIGKTHIKEGVVVRIVNRPKFTAYKLKNFEFKVLENIIKTNAEVPDMEEAQDV